MAGTDDKDTFLRGDVDALHFMAWLDCVERIDTLLLECRHLQQNIISDLHAPVLNAVLRYEENCIWPLPDNGESNSKPNSNDDETDTEDPENGNRAPKCKNTTAHPSLKERCAQDILDFPKFSELRQPISGDGTSEEARTESRTQRIDNEIGKRIKNQLEVDIADFVIHGQWNRDQRHLYHLLRALQSLKRNMYLDRLTLFDWGYDLFDVQQDLNARQCHVEPRRQIDDFLILRRALLARAGDYVGRLGDHLVTYHHVQDYGLHDHPRPSIERRREQHTYAVHLRDRCHETAKEMHHLLRTVASDLTNNQPIKAQVFHRWQRDFSSHSYSTRAEIPDEQNNRDYQHFIVTSYWMPERPDLQSVIAHEVAHGVLRETTSDLFLQRLDQHDDAFSRLAKHLIEVVQVFSKSGMVLSPTTLVREMLVDILAVSVYGASYVYALYLESLGIGLEEQFCVGELPDSFELDAIDDIPCAIDGYGRGDLFEWYIRLNAVCDWLEKVGHAPPVILALQKRMIHACQASTNGLFDYIQKHSNTRHQDSSYWRSLSAHIKETLIDSQLAGSVHEWLKKRNDDHYRRKNKRKIDSTYEKGARVYPRYSRQLHPLVRNFLVTSFLDRKWHQYDALNRDKDDARRAETMKIQMERCYGLEFKPNNTTSDDQENKPNHYSLVAPPLFSRLYEIPWTCALLRGLDFTHHKSKLKPKSRSAFRTAVHYHTELGRELYQLALDFFLQDTESAWNRLVEAIRLVHAEVRGKDREQTSEVRGKDREQTSEELSKQLTAWIDQPTDNEANIEQFIRWVSHTNGQKETTVWQEIVASYGAEFLAQSSERIGKPNLSRPLERIQGMKLGELFEILDNEKEPLSPRMAALRSALILRHRGTSKQEEKKSKETNGGKADRKRKMLERLLKGFSRCDADEKDRVQNRTYILNRICISGGYLPIRYKVKGGGNGQEDYGHGNLTQVLYASKDDSGQAEPDGKIESWQNRRGEWKNHWGRYYTLLGRYDVVSWKAVQPMCRCRLPQFPRVNNDAANPLTAADEKWPGFFVRREMVVPFRLGKRPWGVWRKETSKEAGEKKEQESWRTLGDECDDSQCKSDIEYESVYALISISLHRTATRLDFLLRLIEAIHSDKRDERDKVEGTLTLTDLHDILSDRNGDRAFLCDGWGDVLLVLGDGGKDDRLPKKEDRLEEVFKIQDILFRDFQVERAEISLSRQCIEHAAMSPEKFRISIHTRLLEDRGIDDENKRYVNDFKKLLCDGAKNDIPSSVSGEDIGKYVNLRDQVMLTGTPGRMDYSLRFKKDCPKKLGQMPVDGGSWYDALIDLMVRDAVDRVQTNIGKTEYSRE